MIPFKGALSSYHPPLLSISQISSTKLRFSVEGKVSNKYGTYKLNNDFNRYLKGDLVDKEHFHTITLVISDPNIAKYVDKIDPGNFIRVEGGVIASKNLNDGGSSSYSIHVDATTLILKAELFECSLVFMPKISHKFLASFVYKHSLKPTFVLVVIQADKCGKGTSAAYDELTIVDGPSVTDRARVKN
eukprot:c94_g1_i1 orf=540-1103(-)